MDPLSHAALGAALAQPVARRGQLRTAACIGGVSAMAPDLDLLIRSPDDPLLALEFHRHFTHSLAFAPIGALLCTAVLYPVVRGRVGFGAACLFSVLGFASHGLLDAFTSYGTRLWWPFSDVRVAWDSISAIDPLLTLPLFALALLGLWRRRGLLGVLGVAWCASYLGLGAYQNQRATAATRELAAARAHTAERLEIKPTVGNVVLWKSIYERRGRYYIDAVRVARGTLFFPGESLRKLDVARDFPWLEPGTQQWRDVERFATFADGWLAVDRNRQDRIVDIRYSLVPTRGDGFWAIELDPDAPADAHVGYVTMRIRPTAEGRELLDMLFP